MENKCPQCQSELKFKQGISKLGKPYAGDFCQNPDCKFVSWHKLENNTHSNWDYDKRISSLADRVSELERIVKSLTGENLEY